MAAGGAWAVLIALLGLERLGAPIQPLGIVVAAFAALAGSVTAGMATGSHFWRGPVVLDFPTSEGAICEPPEAEVVRRAALLRGSLGGAGYVHRWSLAFPTLAWSLAAAIATQLMREPRLEAIGIWPPAALALAAVATRVFPARPFFYRERVGGALILHPAETWIRLGPPNPGRRTRWIDLTFRTIEPDGRAMKVEPSRPVDKVGTRGARETADQEREG